MRILVIEDDLPLSRLLQRSLTAEGYVVDVANMGEEGRMLAVVNEYAGIVLDMQLTDRNGLTILQELRREGNNTPVLVFTGQDGESDIVRALDAGADEYVVKPVSTRELAARMRALVRRSRGLAVQEQLAAGHVVLNRITRELRIAGTPLDLTPKEFSLLELLLVHIDAVVPRTMLLEKVWHMDFDPGTNIVDVHVGRLRRKLDEHEAGVRIETVRGEGYRLITTL